LLITVLLTVLDYNYICLQPLPQKLPMLNMLAYLTTIKTIKSFIPWASKDKPTVYEYFTDNGEIKSGLNFIKLFTSVIYEFS
jgi:hypothetical protein